MVPTHQPQHQSPSKQTVPESESKKRRHGAADERTVACSESPDWRKANCAEKCRQTWVKWIEFKPGRSTGPTKNDRSSRSSDDLSKEEGNVADPKGSSRTGRCSEDEGRASHGKRKNAVPAGGLNPVRYENTPQSPARRAPHAPDGTRGLSATSPQMA